MNVPDTLIPIIVVPVVFGFSALVVIAILIARHRAGEVRHQTIRLALEKGQALPPELMGRRRAPRGLDQARGIKLVALGIGVTASLWFGGHGGWAAGLVLVALGAGFIVADRLAPQEPPAPLPPGT